MHGREYVVRDSPEELRHEILKDGELVGEIRYRTEPGVIVLVHTEVARAALLLEYPAARKRAAMFPPM
jgi:hypothetical protein